MAAEKLREAHGIALGRETLRLWMLEAGIWADRKQRRKRVHQPRHRRECVGELVQIDGGEHWWFEDRGPQCTLLVFVDDATSRLMHLLACATIRSRSRSLRFSWAAISRRSIPSCGATEPTTDPGCAAISAWRRIRSVPCAATDRLKVPAFDQCAD